jgi:hypothetical protein
MQYIFSTPVLINHLRQLKTGVFLQRCLICIVLFLHEWSPYDTPLKDKIFSLAVDSRLGWKWLALVLIEQRILDTNEGKTTVLSCFRHLINTGVEKNEKHLNIDINFYHQMSLSKSKC